MELYFKNSAKNLSFSHKTNSKTAYTTGGKLHANSLVKTSDAKKKKTDLCLEKFVLAKWIVQRYNYI